MYSILQNILNFAVVACRPKGTFFGLPTWYKYLQGQSVDNVDITGSVVQSCVPVINNLKDVWRIVFAIIDLLLRLAIIAAIGFVLAGGAKLMFSQGQPDKIKTSITMIVNAIIGLVIAVAAATVIGYIGSRF